MPHRPPRLLRILARLYRLHGPQRESLPPTLTPHGIPHTCSSYSPDSRPRPRLLPREQPLSPPEVSPGCLQQTRRRRHRFSIDHAALSASPSPRVRRPSFCRPRRTYVFTCVPGRAASMVHYDRLIPLLRVCPPSGIGRRRCHIIHPSPPCITLCLWEAERRLLHTHRPLFSVLHTNPRRRYHF
ncbi:hypothetical protein B0H12DRAFT_1129222 [Mycena haematopus]|nr:hypothetical protein B0H12DRAFT_1129222 [Mycena haematopus]